MKRPLELTELVAYSSSGPEPESTAPRQARIYADGVRIKTPAGLDINVYALFSSGGRYGAIIATDDFDLIATVRELLWDINLAMLSGRRVSILLDTGGFRTRYDVLGFRQSELVCELSIRW